jgi:DNA-binding NtrC family response regulator
MSVQEQRDGYCVMKCSTHDSLEYSVSGDSPDVLVGQDPAVGRVAHHAERAAQVECTVLITGDTGTGKEVWARLLHRIGPRHNRPFVPVNCAALTPTLAESQLFGHEKGAFTGAAGASLGVFRSGDRGIVFLDEVGDMPLELQPKLLRVLQESEVTPVGAAYPEHIDVQIIAATNRDLQQEVAEGRFREDLYYRLNLVELHMPPLRERAIDIPAFIKFFSRKYADRYQQPLWIPDAETLRSFCEYSWPGNIRQLSYAIEQGYVLEHAPTVPNQRAPNQSAKQQPTAQNLPFFDLTRLRKTALEQAMRATGGHKGKAASLLGIHPNTMTRMLTLQRDEKGDCEIDVRGGR